MRLRRTLALLACLALPAAAEFKDGVYLSAEQGTRFTLPKTWKLEEGSGEDGKVAVFQDADGGIRGVFRHVKAGMGAAKHAKWRFAEWGTSGAAVTWEGEEKPKGRKGDWLQVKMAIEEGKDKFKSAHLFFSRGLDDCELSMLVKADKWSDSETAIHGILASLEFAPATGWVWADATRGIAVRGAPGWKFRTGHFEIKDPSEIVEWETGDLELLVSLNEVKSEAGLEVKAWADEMVKALGSDFAGQKLVEVASPPGLIRRDFTADNGGSPIRFACLFFERNGHFYQLQVMVLGDRWEPWKEDVEAMFTGLLQGDVSAQVEEMKEQAIAAGGAEIVLPNPWEGCGMGSWAKFRVVSDVADAKSAMEMTTTLVAIEAESFTTNNEMTMGGKPVPAQKQRVDLRQKAAEGDAPRPEEGDERITVPKGEFACHWSKTKTPLGWTKTWTCKDVPGGTVKVETELLGKQGVVVLVDFEKK